MTPTPHDPGGDSHRANRAWLLALLLVWTSSGLYVFSSLDRGWMPTDEGTFGQTAERVLQGEIPHRDFDDMYTGGLTYLNALALKILGCNSYSLRLVLFFFFMGAVPVIFYLASRWCGRFGSAGVTALAVVWTIPNYPEPTPSWYNLFFAVFGLGAACRYIETKRLRWLVLAGFFGGLSFLIKLIGLYYVLGVMLYLVFEEQTSRQDQSPPATHGTWYSAFVLVGLFVFLAGVTMVVTQQRGSTYGTLLLLAPVSVVVWFIAGRELRAATGNPGKRLSRLLRTHGSLLAGAAVPVGLFAVFYGMNGAFPELLQGLFVLPFRRLTFAAGDMPPPNPLTVAPCLALLGAVLAGKGRLARPALLVAAGATLTVVLVLSARSTWLYQVAYWPTLFATPFAVASVGAILGTRTTIPRSDHRTQQLVLVCAVSAVCWLTVFPYPLPVYFTFVFPLALLVLVAALGVRRQTGHPVIAMLLGFYVVFAIFRVNPGQFHSMGVAYSPALATTRLAVPRAGGLRVLPGSAQMYERVLRLVAEHVKDGAVYAFPDAPEIYFLAGLPNPTRTIFDFMAKPPISDADRLETVRARGVTVVVINTGPGFSGAPSSEIISQMRRRFPETESVGRFLVLWRR